MPKDITGKKFGRWAVLEVVRANGELRCKCLCECGKLKTVNGYHLLGGNTKSCGCYQRQCVSKANRTHGLSQTKEHKAWRLLKNRCLNPKDKRYKSYGGRGITVCDRWKDSFENFYADMGPSPSKDHSIDRIDNNGNYSPENCRWATRSEQGRNTRRNRYLTVGGETKTITEWAEWAEMSVKSLRSRIKLGWDIKRALEQPIGINPRG